MSQCFCPNVTSKLDQNVASQRELTVGDATG